MVDVNPAPAAFARFRSAICGDQDRSPVQAPWLEGTPPSGLIWQAGANDNLREFQPLHLNDVRDAIKHISVDRLNDRNGWRERVCYFAGEIALHPELEADLRPIVHEMSRRAVSFGNSAGTVYPQSKNDEILDEAIADAQRKLANGEQITTIKSLFKEARNNGWTSGPVTQPQVLAFQPVPGELFGAFAARPLFKRRPIFGAYLYLGEITLLSGPGGVSKSTFASSIAMSVASGMPLLGIKSAQRQVLFINLEDSAGEVHLKLTAVARNANLPVSSVANHIRIIGAEDAHRFILTEADEKGKLRLRDAGFDELRRVIEHDRPELVVIDPIVLLMAEGQNDNGTMAQVQRRLKQMAVELGFALLQVAHTRKGSNAASDGADATAGAGALTNLARAAFGVVPVTEARARELGIPPDLSRHYREVLNTKANFAPIMDGFVLELVQVGMANATPDFPIEDKVPVAVRYIPPVAGGSWITPQLQRDVLVAIAKGASGSPLSPTTQGARAHQAHCASAVSPHRQAKTQAELDNLAKAVVADVVARGWVVSAPVAVAKSSGGINKAKGLFVKWSLTPWAGDSAPGPFVA